MSSRVNIVSANFLNNSQAFTDKIDLEITFEVFDPLPGDLEWALIYVPTGGTNEFDQRLDSVLVGPTPEGRHRFVLSVDAPDPSKIPKDDLIGASVLLLEVKYNEQLFMTLGWFVSVEYNDEELKANPPATPKIDKLSRTVQINDVRVTTFTIRWDPDAPEEMPPVEEGEENPAESMGEQEKEEGIRAEEGDRLEDENERREIEEAGLDEADSDEEDKDYDEEEEEDLDDEEDIDEESDVGDEDGEEDEGMEVDEESGDKQKDGETAEKETARGDDVQEKKSENNEKKGVVEKTAHDKENAEAETQS